METPLAERDEYRSSGRVAPEFFVLATPLAVVSALLMGAALFAIWMVGFYFLIIIPLVAALPVAGALVLAVRLGRCRSRAIAAVYGVLAGLLMYGSYFYFDMVDTNGAGHALRVDAVPAHIWLRLQTDRVEAHPGVGKKNDPPNPWANYVFFVIEAVVICAVTCGVAVDRAGRVYCEEADRWAAYHKLPLVPGKGQQIVDALSSGHLDECLAGLHIVPVRAQQPYCELVLEVCGESPEAEGCCAYISLKEITPGVKSKAKWSVHNFGFETLIRRRALTPDEFRRFQKHFLWQEAAV